MPLLIARSLPPRCIWRPPMCRPRQPTAWTRRVLLGTSGGLTSPIVAPLPARIVDIDLRAGAVWDGGRSRQAKTPLPSSAQAVWTPARARLVPAPQSLRTANLWSDRAQRCPLTVFGGTTAAPRRRPRRSFRRLDRGAGPPAFRARFAAGGMGRLTAFDQAALDRDFDRATN